MLVVVSVKGRLFVGQSGHKTVELNLADINLLK